MLRSFAQEITTDGLIDNDASVVVGVSGGPDSMALLHLLLGLNKSHDWNLKIHVAHLNHQLRTRESEEDAAFVQAAADAHALPCTIDSRNIADIAEDEGLGIEEVGRRERYAFYERVCLTAGSSIVAIAHQQDDNAETILQRILRGTGVRGLAGIPRARKLSPQSDITIVRPLLRRSREWVMTYLADEGVAYRDDRTNLSNEPMRNRIRNKIIPTLADEVNPQVKDALIRLGEQAQWVEEYLRETVERTFDTLIVSRNDQELTINADALARKSRIVQTEIIRLAYRSFGLGEQDLAFTHLVAALELVSDPTSGRQVQLPRGMTLEKRYGHLSFAMPTDEPREEISPEIAIHLPGQTVLPIRRLIIDCEILQVTESEMASLRRLHEKSEEYVDFDAVHPPLVVRTRKPGDRFFPLGAPGSKKLSDFLADTKVSPKARKRVAVLCDQLGPIWVIGHRLDERVKLTALTRKVLHLNARPLEG
ncbi:MAG: tRNA lysidine(34) synthetase TilS [Planctomycetota bacterium]|jgi:tRNA(Ile)-lysidine synthase